MTTRIILQMIIVMLLALSGCARKPQPPAAQGIEVTIRPGVLDALEKSRPQDVAVPKTIATKPEVWMERLQQVTRIKGDVKDTQEHLQVSDGSRYMEIRRISNGAFFGDMKTLWRAEPSPQRTKFEVPDDATAKKITVETLKRFGFGKTDMQRIDVSVSDELFEITLPDQPTEPITIVVGKNVDVRRIINELPVYGPGSKIKLYLSEGNDVNGFTVVWRQFEPSSSVLGHEPQRERPPVERVKPISSIDAFALLKAKPLDHLPIALVDKIDIEDVKFGYYSRSAVEAQQFLQPVYVFSGLAHAKLPDGKSVTVPYEQFIVALKTPMESIWPEQKTFRSDTRKKDMKPIEQDKDEIVPPR